MITALVIGGVVLVGGGVYWVASRRRRENSVNPGTETRGGRRRNED